MRGNRDSSSFPPPWATALRFPDKVHTVKFPKTFFAQTMFASLLLQLVLLPLQPIGVRELIELKMAELDNILTCVETQCDSWTFSCDFQRR